MKAHLQEHSLCVLRSGLASSHLASDNSQRDEVSRCCAANVFLIQCRGRERCSESDFRRGHLPLVIFRVALVTRIGRFINAEGSRLRPATAGLGRGKGEAQRGKGKDASVR
jgi:hypothetical protein